MGVYIFRSRNGPFIKVGHYAGHNAYSRVAHRGFYSCVCPPAIRDRVSVEDLELMAWFPRLTRKDECTVKRKWKTVRVCKSEWYPEEILSEIMTFLCGLDTNEMASCDLSKAMATRRRL